MRRLITFFALAFAFLFVRRASADDRATIADALTTVATTAETFARTADASQDRAVRRKVATRAREIGEDLTALARRARKDTPLAAIARDAANIGKDTAQLVDLADEAADKTERKALRAQATVIDQQLAAARAKIDAAAAADGARPAPAAKPAPMAPERFAALIATLAKEGFDDKRLGVLGAAFPTNWFTTAQVGSVMDAMTMGKGKVEAAVLLWSHIVDPENGYTLYGKLTFQNDKDELKKRTAGK
jgi:hypothetical protein